MKGSHPRPADRCPFVLRHSISQVTSFMQLGMLCKHYFHKESRLQMGLRIINFVDTTAISGVVWLSVLVYAHTHIYDNNEYYVNVFNTFSRLSVVVSSYLFKFGWQAGERASMKATMLVLDYIFLILKVAPIFPDPCRCLVSNATLVLLTRDISRSCITR